MQRCPGCNAKIENEQIARFSIQDATRERLEALEHTHGAGEAPSTPAPAAVPRRRFYFGNALIRGRDAQESQADAGAAGHNGRDESGAAGAPAAGQ